MWSNPARTADQFRPSNSQILSRVAHQDAPIRQFGEADGGSGRRFGQGKRPTSGRGTRQCRAPRSPRGRRSGRQTQRPGPPPARLRAKAVEDQETHVRRTVPAGVLTLRGIGGKNLKAKCAVAEAARQMDAFAGAAASQRMKLAAFSRKAQPPAAAFHQHRTIARREHAWRILDRAPRHAWQRVWTRALSESPHNRPPAMNQTRPMPSSASPATGAAISRRPPASAMARGCNGTNRPMSPARTPRRSRKPHRRIAVRTTRRFPRDGLSAFRTRKSSSRDAAQKVWSGPGQARRIFSGAVEEDPIAAVKPGYAAGGGAGGFPQHEHAPRLVFEYIAAFLEFKRGRDRILRPRGFWGQLLQRPRHFGQAAQARDPQSAVVRGQEAAELLQLGLLRVRSTRVTG